MERGGVRDGRLAVTELQMFAHLAPGPGGQEARRLDWQNLVNPATLAEALYDTCIYHAAVRLSLCRDGDPFRHGEPWRRLAQRA